MQTTQIKKNKDIITIQWLNDGSIGVDENGKVWQNIDNPVPFANPLLKKEPQKTGFLSPLLDHIDNYLKNTK